jgi:hypothetical protein
MRRIFLTFATAAIALAPMLALAVAGAVDGSEVADLLERSLVIG